MSFLLENGAAAAAGLRVVGRVDLRVQAVHKVRERLRLPAGHDLRHRKNADRLTLPQNALHTELRPMSVDQIERGSVHSRFRAVGDWGHLRPFVLKRNLSSGRTNLVIRQSSVFDNVVVAVGCPTDSKYDECSESSGSTADVAVFPTHATTHSTVLEASSTAEVAHLTLSVEHRVAILTGYTPRTATSATKLASETTVALAPVACRDGGGVWDLHLLRLIPELHTR